METLGMVISLILIFVAYMWAKNRKNTNEGKINNEDESNIDIKNIKYPSTPYKLHKSLLTSREKELYQILTTVLEGTSYIIAIKPRLADFIGMTISHKQNKQVYYQYFNQISAKHVDFLICDEELTPKLAIELDDSTHSQKSRIERDRFVNQTYKDIGLGIIHIHEYTKESIEARIFEFLLIKK